MRVFEITVEREPSLLRLELFLLVLHLLLHDYIVDFLQIVSQLDVLLKFSRLILKGLEIDAWSLLVHFDKLLLDFEL